MIQPVVGLPARNVTGETLTINNWRNTKHEERKMSKQIRR